MRHTLSTMYKSIRSVAVIGAGPTGVGFAKALIKENHFKNITLFERRSEFGGLWNYSKSKTNDKSLLYVPSEDPFLPNSSNADHKASPYETPLIADGSSSSPNYVWPSAIYDDLDTNVPKDLMAYNKFPFKETLPLFPTHGDVLEYIRDYSKEVQSLVKFSTKVVSVEFINGDGTVINEEAVHSGKVKYLPDIDKDEYQWRVITRPVVEATKGGTEASVDPKYADKIDYYDAVAVASGNYDSPYIPDFPGLEEWNNAFPGSVIHAKYYKSPRDYTKNDKILVVGNSASGGDIAYQLAIHLQVPVYKSKRSENKQPAGQDKNIKDVANIKQFRPETKEIEFVDGTVLEGVTDVIFATGYLRSFPHLNSLSLPFLPEFKSTPESIIANKIQPIVSSGFKINGFFRHLLSYQYPGLAVIGVPKYVLPTRLSETQGAWVSRVWLNRIKLPGLDKQKKWELERTEEVGGNEGHFHGINYPQDVEYYNLLNNEILESGTDYGLLPTIWDERQVQIRANVKKIKEAYIQYKKDKSKLAFSLKELEDSGYLVYDD